MLAIAWCFPCNYKPADADIAQVVTSHINANGMRVAGAGESGLVLTIESSARQELLFGNHPNALADRLNLINEKETECCSQEYLIVASL